jgi:hypothetical protein
MAENLQTTGFHIAFQQSKTVIFEVSYYTLGNNKHPYFSTQAARFCRSKRDFSECGQAQDRLLAGDLRKFWRKWDSKHLSQLDGAELEELERDLEALKQTHNWYVKDSNDPIPFSVLRYLSMQPVRKAA